MDPIIGGSLISAGASLLGGIFGKSKPKYVTPDYAKIRRKAEAAGFNPLTALTSAPGQVVQSQNYMGSAIADAGLLLADGMAKKAEQEGEVSKLREQNQKLAEKLQQATLRPRIGGIYAATESTPSLRQALGGKNAGTAKSASVASVLGDVPVPDPFLDRGSPAFAFGSLLEAPPGFTSPSTMEDEVVGDNELLTWPYGALWGSAAAGFNLHKAFNYARGTVQGSGPVMSIGGREFVMERRREPAKNERVRQRLRERLKRGEKLTPSEMIAAGH